VNKTGFVASRRFGRDSFPSRSAPRGTGHSAAIREKDFFTQSAGHPYKDGWIEGRQMTATSEWPVSGQLSQFIEDKGEVHAILGPTNTGKTHHAIARMLAHRSGVIGLPLRLLAREVYAGIVERAGAAAVALITGEERINPGDPRYWVCTVEAMPRGFRPDFLAVDEIQLAADLQRGHVFTDRLINYRGRVETLFLGAATIEPVVRALVPEAMIATRPRLSSLNHAGERKLTRLPRRSAVVAFSARDVYEIAELLRRRHGGAAVVLGALSPRTRNAQVQLYQNGDVDYIVATDAIGMGLNLDIDHVAFASDQKFDGREFRRLTFAEFAQIAGRAGRNRRDGSFGETGRCPPFEPELVEALENHVFGPASRALWRNSELDFSSIDALQHALRQFPERAGLMRSESGDDIRALDILSLDPAVRRPAKTPADVARLWDACQIPDYRNVSGGAHAELVKTVFEFIVRKGNISEDWFWRHLSSADRTEGDLDALSSRIDQVRSCAYMANREDWLVDPGHWQVMARQVEDRLSDALHERLAQRFVDRRTSFLLRRYRENAMLNAEVTSAGDVLVEGQTVGRLQGFRFAQDTEANSEAAKVAGPAIAVAIAREGDIRAARLSEAVDSSLVLANDGAIRWLGDPIAKLVAGEKLLQPRAVILADEAVTNAAKEAGQRRLDLWVTAQVRRVLGPLLDLEAGEGLDGAARGVAFQLAESLGVLERGRVAQDVKGLDQNARGVLRKLGVRFGAYYVYVPALLKPAPRLLALQLWTLKNSQAPGDERLGDLPQLAAGRTSFVADKSLPRETLRIAGFRLCGERAVRVDILERLADLIRPAVAYRPGASQGPPPPGAADGDGFVVTVAMTSLTGCSGEALGAILRSIGFESRPVKGPAITVPLKAPEAPPAPSAAETESRSAMAPVPSPIEIEPHAEAPASIVQPADASPQTETEATVPIEHPGEIDVQAPGVEPQDDPTVEPHLQQDGDRAVETAEISVATSEAPDGSPSKAESAEASPQADGAMIEVWRPVRHRRVDRGAGHRRDKPAQAAAAAPDDASVEAKPSRWRGRGKGRADFKARPEATPNADNRAVTEGAPAQTAEAPVAAPESKRAPADPRAGQARRNVSAPAPRARREQPIDPNSPFAKLAALKAQLEAKQRGE
jgi:ATP-dependent RNA helicase SUPV3L1/SUV3